MLNADEINRTLLQSLSSDSASTQKSFNRLVEIYKREDDRQCFGLICECPDVIELIENFCCMQLGGNILKAFFDGVKTSTADNHLVCDVHVLVHELVS